MESNLSINVRPLQRRHIPRMSAIQSDFRCYQALRNPASEHEQGSIRNKRSGLNFSASAGSWSRDSQGKRSVERCVEHKIPELEVCATVPKSVQQCRQRLSVRGGQAEFQVGISQGSSFSVLTGHRLAGGLMHPCTRSRCSDSSRCPPAVYHESHAAVCRGTRSMTCHDIQAAVGQDFHSALPRHEFRNDSAISHIVMEQCVKSWTTTAS